MAYSKFLFGAELERSQSGTGAESEPAKFRSQGAGVRAIKEIGQLRSRS